MSSDEVTQGDPAPSRGDRATKRLIGIDAARGLALIGLMAIHLYPSADWYTHEPTLAWVLFSGDSAALFALLAGIGLAFSSGGTTPHRGRRMTADRVGLMVRALIIGIVALVISAILPQDPPAYSILLYYAVLFLLAIPFLRLGPRALFLSAAVFAIVSPILLQQLASVLPASSVYNHTLVTLFTEPAAMVSELLLTGSYPALPYMSYILVGLGLGRLNLRDTRIQVIIAGVGGPLAVVANLVSALLLYATGGYQALLQTPGMSQGSLEEALVFGPGAPIPNTSGWWLAIATPHTNTPLALTASLGIALLVLGVFLLLAAKAGRWLIPLATMGSMTFTIYSIHLIALAPELHYDNPNLWFILQLGVAAAFAWLWDRSLGQGPLELLVSRSVKGTRHIVAGKNRDTSSGEPTAEPFERTAGTDTNRHGPDSAPH